MFCLQMPSPLLGSMFFTQIVTFRLKEDPDAERRLWLLRPMFIKCPENRREALRTRGGNDDNDPTRTDRHRRAYILWEEVITKQGTPGSRGGKHTEDKRTGETN